MEDPRDREPQAVVPAVPLQPLCLAALVRISRVLLEAVRPKVGGGSRLPPNDVALGH